MTWRTFLTSLIAGMAGAAIVLAIGWAWNSHGGLVQAPSGAASAQPATTPAASWRVFAGKSGYDPSCDYRLHLLIPPAKAAKISINLSRYAAESSVFYPTIVSSHFLQAVIMAPGEPIALDVSDAKSEGCEAGNARLDNLPDMCFETKIEERCP